MVKKTLVCMMALLCIGSLLPAGSPAQEKSAAEGKQTFSKKGITVELDFAPVNDKGGAPVEPMENRDVAISFKVTDSATGAVVAGIRPSAWIDARASQAGLSKEAAAAVTCQEKIKSFMQGSLAFRPAIDLNTYYILTLNAKPSISVIDPQLGVYVTKVVTVIPLKSPGEDWARTADSRRLFVSLPKENQVAVINTDIWRVAENIAAGTHPVRIAFQPDEKYLWVGNDLAGADAAAGGVTVLDPDTRKVVAAIPTGAGHHELAFSPDSRYAFVTNRADGTVAVIDIPKLEKVKTLRTGPSPVSLAYSTQAEALYVADESEGRIAVVDGRRHVILTHIEAKPGLRSLRFSPDGRWGFAVNYAESLVHIVDASVNRIRHNVAVGARPDQVAFTAAFAFIRPTGSDQVNAIQLSLLDKVGTVPALKFSGGQAMEKSKNPPLADLIVPTPEGDVVLIANPVDDQVYYYMEGMLAPMGSFLNYGRQVRGVQVVDRSLKETAPGIYTSSVKLPSHGTYDVAFLMDNPVVYNCFDLEVKADPALIGKTDTPIRMEFISQQRTIKAGEAHRLRFKVFDTLSNQPRADLKDLRARYFQTTANWNKWAAAASLGEGIYEVEITTPGPGLTYVFFECPSLSMRADKLPSLALQATAGGPGADSQKQPKAAN